MVVMKRLSTLKNQGGDWKWWKLENPRCSRRYIPKSRFQWRKGASLPLFPPSADSLTGCIHRIRSRSSA